MAKDDRLYLGNMWDMIRRARRLLGDKNLTQFLKDETLRFALAHLVQIIGEAASHVSDATRTSLPDIEWDEIVGMRQKIVHDYLNVKFELVWQTVVEDLPELERHLEPLDLGDEPPEEY